VAALLARQRLLKDKHALEEQEERIRKRKEQLQLEADIAASMVKMAVLGASGSMECCYTAIRWNKVLYVEILKINRI